MRHFPFTHPPADADAPPAAAQAADRPGHCAAEAFVINALRNEDDEHDTLSFEQRRRLSWFAAGYEIERQLIEQGVADPDHVRSRRTAFALWLRATGRLSEDLRV